MPLRSLAILSTGSVFLLAGCSAAPVAQDPASDPTCVVYFDGCNTCTKMGGGAACTKKYCDAGAMQQPYCIERTE